MSDIKEQIIKNPIIPIRQTFLDVYSNAIVPWSFNNSHSLDLKAICFFVSTGFFPDDATYYNQIKVIPPATIIDNDDPIKAKTYWQWHYSPRDISFKQAVEEFAHVFETITLEQTHNKKIILPLSGGLDSRSQAAALDKHSQVFAYSYKFKNGIPETEYGEAIAKVQGYKFKSFTIEPNYLWGVIEHLADINRCFSEFTHPRQMAIHKDFSEMGELFFLGHWGDVLFDDMGVSADLTNEDLVKVIYKKVIKKGGLELAERLWNFWGLSGTFEDYLMEKILNALEQTGIENANTRLRAYKSLQWAPRWTSNNLSIFEDKHPLALPYYHDEICKFICTIPEEYLAGRKIQIAYIKDKAPQLANIPWQTFDPCNLYNYQKFNSFQNMIIRGARKYKNKMKATILRKPVILRNWELQFLGPKNEVHLENYLFNNDKFNQFIPHNLVKEFYSNFKQKDQVWYSHPLSMLLTLSLFSSRHFNS
ncbi:hypothetical protein BH23BAC1_BH23BAC1_15600 [soil metagenome]